MDSAKGLFNFYIATKLYNDILFILVIRLNLETEIVTDQDVILCPNETLYIYCSTNKSSLMWTLPVDDDNEVPFWNNDVDCCEVRKPILLWRDSNRNEPLVSHIDVPYSPELNNRTFYCGNDNDRMKVNVTYKLAGMMTQTSCMSFYF